MATASALRRPSGLWLLLDAELSCGPSGPVATLPDGGEDPGDGSADPAGDAAFLAAFRDGPGRLVGGRLRLVLAAERGEAAVRSTAGASCAALQPGSYCCGPAGAAVLGWRWAPTPDPAFQPIPDGTSAAAWRLDRWGGTAAGWSGR